VGHVTLANERLRAVVDGVSGALADIEHLNAKLSLVSNRALATRHPFMVVLHDGTFLRDWRQCAVEPRSGNSDGVRIQWSLSQGMVLSVAWRLESSSGDLRCNVKLHNPEHVPVAAVAYPYVAGIGRLGERPNADELVHPYATGFLVRNPLDSLPVVDSETRGEQPVVLGLYPEGFSGSTMQFMAYSAVGRGGFYVATEDSAGHEKWLNFYRHPDGDLRLAIWHSPTDYQAGLDVSTAYETVLAAIDGGTWYDAADRYRLWAHRQPWTAQGPLWSQENRPRWLFEQVGLCTFGINPSYDRTPWLAEIDRIAGTPVLHLLGPNWANKDANYYNSLPGGLDDWFPARFHAGNLAVIRDHGDYLVPFEFDLLFGQGDDRSDAEAGRDALQLIPNPTLSRDAYAFPFLCPVSAFTRRLHLERDRRLVADWGVDGIYYDISVNNVRHICTSGEHGHAPGDSRTVSTAFRSRSPKPPWR
jgi:hypothetical protein